MSAAPAVVKLRHGSVINMEDLKQLNDEMTEVFEERDRARQLAAKLEEVVAMRTAVLKALVAWGNRPYSEIVANPHPAAIIEWAEAQLSEVP